MVGKMPRQLINDESAVIAKPSCVADSTFPVKSNYHNETLKKLDGQMTQDQTTKSQKQSHIIMHNHDPQYFTERTILY